MAVTVTVPPSTTKLIALANLKAILGIADSANDALLGNIIQRGSDAIARFCNRVFAQRTVVETLPGPGGQLRKLKFSPIVTLTSIAYDGETVDSDSYTLIEPAAGIVFCESSWAYTGHKYSYTATYVHIPVIPATQSSAKLPRHPEEACHLIQTKAATPSERSDAWVAGVMLWARRVSRGRAVCASHLLCGYSRPRGGFAA